MPRATSATRAAPAADVGRTLRSALTFDVECLTSRSARRGPRHTVTLHPDGALETPHDLAAERVAVALGGYCSCLELADAPPGLLADAVGLLTRRIRPLLRRRSDGHWSLARTRTCDCPASFRSAADAAAHARGPHHLAARHGSHERLVRLVLDGLDAVLPGRPPEDAGLAARVRGPAGLARLWAAGVHPDDVAAWAGLASVVAEPLPTSYYLGVAYGVPDQQFLREALPGRPDGDTAAWLAWLPAEVRRGTECRGLLAAGLSRDEVLVLLSADVGPEWLLALAADSGLPVDAVARRLAAWAPAGCFPGAAHLRVLAGHGLDAHRPSPALLDRLEADAAGLPAPPSRTELGVMAALVGGRGGVLEALGRGIRSAAELVERMEEQ